MELVLDPPRGVDPLRLGMTFDEAVAAVAPWGEPKVFGPYEHLPMINISTSFHGVGIEVLLEREERVTAVELWHPTSTSDDVRVLWGDADIFRTPADDILERAQAQGITVNRSNPERPFLPGITLAFTRMTSQEVPRNAHGLPVHFSSVLVGDEKYKK